MEWQAGLIVIVCAVVLFLVLVDVVRGLLDLLRF